MTTSQHTTQSWQTASHSHTTPYYSHDRLQAMATPCHTTVMTGYKPWPHHSILQSWQATTSHGHTMSYYMVMTGYKPWPHHTILQSWQATTSHGHTMPYYTVMTGYKLWPHHAILRGHARLQAIVTPHHTTHTQKRFCNISCIDGCLVAQNTVAEIWSNVW